jgi:hypothetical protein
MAALGNLVVSMNLEPFVKLLCANEQCKYSLLNKPEADHAPYCNLKHIQINEVGKCEMFEPKKDEGE